MSESELLSQAIGLIYDAALDSALWPAALEGIRDFVRGSAANFFWQDVSKQDAGIFHCIGIEQPYLESYFAEYAKINPLYPSAAFLDAGQVFEGDDIVPWSEMTQTRFYKEWMQPQGLTNSLAVNLEKSVTTVAALAVLRREENGPVDRDARRRMTLIVPHMIRGASIGQLIGQRALERSLLTDTLNSLSSAVFLVETDGRIVFTNQTAVRLLSNGHFVREISGGRLVFAEQDAHVIFQRALRAAAGPEQRRTDTNGTAIVLSTQGARRWLAHVLPLTSGGRRDSGLKHSAVAAVFLREAALNIPSPLENLSKSYNLTASETKVLLAAVEVGGVSEIARSLGISEQTVKTHLKRIFGKTGTKRQAELTKLMASFAGSL
jgi:DNA-binding CsgD family transcriptional regulator